MLTAPEGKNKIGTSSFFIKHHGMRMYGEVEEESTQFILGTRYR
jgi:hypothetical protein